MTPVPVVPSIEKLLRSALSDHPDCLRAYDIAVSDLVASNAPFRVSAAMKAEAAATILELVGSGQLAVDELARHAVNRVHGTDFRLSRTAYAG